VVVSMVRLGSHLPLVLALTLAACGGEDRGRPQATLSTDAGHEDPCQAAVGLQFQNIVNFEGDSAECDLAVAPATGLNQCVFLNYDSETSPRSCVIPEAKPCLLQTGEQVPDDVCLDQDPGRGSKLHDTKIEGGGRCGSSTGALHYVAHNVAICIDPKTKRQGWGTTLQATFNWTSSGVAQTALDARAWDGVSFWIRRGTGSTGTAVLVSVADVFSAVAIDSMGDGGETKSSFCSSLPGAADSEKCDPFGAAVLMTDEWRFVKLPFARLQQKGFGVPAPTGHVDTAALVGLQFNLAAGNWDLWIDDIAFYREAK